MTVFRVLFNMWKDFCSFRSSINDENLLKVLDKKLIQHRADVRAKKEANERKKIAKQEAEKRRKEKEEKEKKELKSMEQLMRYRKRLLRSPTLRYSANSCKLHVRKRRCNNHLHLQQRTCLRMTQLDRSSRRSSKGCFNSHPMTRTGSMNTVTMKQAVRMLIPTQPFNIPYGCNQSSQRFIEFPYC